MPAADLRERAWTSQFSTPVFGLRLRDDSGALTDADANAVTVTALNAAGAPVLSRPATRNDTGDYSVELSSAETAIVGVYTLRWDYSVDGLPEVYETYYEVAAANGEYDGLSDDMKGLVESVWMRFADLFDSPLGGPFLQTKAVAHFGRGRLAQLLRVAMGKLNTVAQPHMTYTLDPTTKPFPVAQWGPLLEQGLYIETIKHLIRSYVEQPNVTMANVAHLDRRDYMARWQEILTMETDEYKQQMEGFKIAHMGLGRPHVKVAGGIYGTMYGPIMPLSAAARPHYWSAGGIY